jgi:DNA processing protein
LKKVKCLLATTNKEINIEEKILWLQICFSKGVGPLTFWKLLQKTNGSVKAAVRLVTPCPEKTAEDILIKHNQTGLQLIFACEKDFPQGLKFTKDCPPVLSVTGSIALLQRRGVAIVGARNASLVGKIFANKMAGNLGKTGLTIISGFARGIDSAAHEGGLATGTIAVLPGGIDVVYPPENADLYKAIIKNNGTILSEMMPGTNIDPALFPRRNRLIAGLADGIILIEAAARSGSLITAKNAVEQGKEIFVVPGHPSDPRSKGGNTLIKQGAALVDSSEDVLEMLNITRNRAIRPEKKQCLEEAVCDTLDNEEAESVKNAILSELSVVPISIEALFQYQNACNFPDFLSILGELELDGKILRHANNEVSLPEGDSLPPF